MTNQASKAWRKYSASPAGATVGEFQITAPPGTSAAVREEPHAELAPHAGFAEYLRHGLDLLYALVSLFKKLKKRVGGGVQGTVGYVPPGSNLVAPRSL